MGLPAPIFSPFIPTPNLFGISVVSGLSGGRSDGQHLPLPQRLEDFGVSHLHVLPVELSTPWVSPLRVFSPFILTPNLFRISWVNGLSGGQADGQHLPLPQRLEGFGVSHLHVLPVERSTPWVSPLRVFSPFILTPNLFGISRVNGMR